MEDDPEYKTSAKPKPERIDPGEISQYLQYNPDYAQVLAVISIAQSLETIAAELKIANDLQGLKLAVEPPSADEIKGRWHGGY